MSTRDQKLFLAVLAAVLIFVVWRQLSPTVSNDGALGMAAGRTGGSRGAENRDVGTDDLPEVVELRLGDLAQVPGQYSPGRDPFRFAPTDRPPPPQPSKEAEEAAKRALEEARAKEARAKVTPPSPPKPQPPAVDVAFLGSFGPRHRRLAVFSDGSEIFNVLEGEILKKSFIVVRIGYESADLGFVGFPDVPAQRLEIGG